MKKESKTNFTKLTQKKGISLIVLIVTIIVIIILAAAVILTLSKNNPIESAREATFKEDVRAFQDELALSISKEYTEKQGQRDEKITASDFDTIKKYIPSFTKKYEGKFVIENDKLVGTDALTEKEVKWSQDLSVVASSKTPVDQGDWDKTATDEGCFIWNGNTIIGYNEEKLAGITNLRIPSKCTAIELEYTYQPDGVRELVSLIEKVEIPDTCVKLGKGAFSEFISLKEVVMSENITEIGEYAFYKCSNLTNITIPESVTSIGDYTFSSCYSLTNIVIPDGVTSIGESAFDSCENLVSIIIPEGVKIISDNTFNGCDNLASITISEGITSIGEGAFSFCSNLENITIPEGVTSIGHYAFYKCSNLESITIPDSVTSIGKEAFYNTAYYNNSSNWENNVLYLNNHLIKAKTNISGEYIIKTGTKSLAGLAFHNCTKLTSVTIPESVKIISDNAFDYCTSLTSITIPEGIKIISDYTFNGCNNLASITIPESVTSIGECAFLSCSSLTNINFQGTISEWNNISKNDEWNPNSAITTITCTDGTINL